MHLLMTLPFLPNIMSESSTTITVAGIAAHVFLSDDILQSRLSTHFVETHVLWKFQLP